MRPAMIISANGLETLKSLETCKLVAFYDVNGWALGYGYHSPNFNEQSTCTQEQANAWLISDTGMLSLKLSSLITVQLLQGQFDALVIFAYNIGINAFASSSLLERLNSGQFNSVPDELFRWVYSNGKVSEGLIARRKVESALWEASSKAQDQIQTKG